MRLVLDGVLEIDWGDGPRTGAAAAVLLCDGWCPPEPADDLAGLSILAVRLAQEIESGSPVELSRWLYAFGRTPAVLADVRTGRHRDGLIRYADRLRLESHYSCHFVGEWEVWGRPPDQSPETAAPRHKLYVSPSSRSLDEVVHLTAELLCEAGVPAFKLVRERGAATRPDKFIVYFHTAEELKRWASRLANQIGGCEGHGVPFTRQMNGEATLSRAVDPQFADAPAKPESWRSWCTDRLGWSLAVARHSAPEDMAMPFWQFALFRLGLEGVDVSQWKLTG